MHGSKFNFVEKIILGESQDEYDPNKLTDEYKKLNERCDHVITKIKRRKKNKT